MDLGAYIITIHQIRRPALHSEGGRHALCERPHGFMRVMGGCVHTAYQEPARYLADESAAEKQPLLVVEGEQDA